MTRERELTQRIKSDYGTVKRFCALHDINYSTYNVVCSGYARSSRLEQILIEKGYIQSADELKRKSA